MPAGKIPNSTALVLWRDPLAAHRQAAEAFAREGTSQASDAGRGGYLSVGTADDQTRYTLWNSLRSLYARRDRDLAQVATSPRTEIPSAFVPRRATIIPLDLIHGISCPATTTTTPLAPAPQPPSGSPPIQSTAVSGGETQSSFTRPAHAGGDMDIDLKIVSQEGSASVVASIPSQVKADDEIQLAGADAAELDDHTSVRPVESQAEEGAKETPLEPKMSEEESALVHAGTEMDVVDDQADVQVEVEDGVGKQIDDLAIDGRDELPKLDLDEEEEGKEPEVHRGGERAQDVLVVVAAQMDEQVGPVPLTRSDSATLDVLGAATVPADGADGPQDSVAEMDASAATLPPSYSPAVGPSAEKEPALTATWDVPATDTDVAKSRSTAGTDKLDIIETVVPARDISNPDNPSADSASSSGAPNKMPVSTSIPPANVAPDLSTVTISHEESISRPLELAASREPTHDSGGTTLASGLPAAWNVVQCGEAADASGSGGRADQSAVGDTSAVEDAPGDSHGGNMVATDVTKVDTNGVEQVNDAASHELSSQTALATLALAHEERGDGYAAHSSRSETRDNAPSPTVPTSDATLRTLHDARDTPPAAIPAPSRAHPSPTPQADEHERGDRSSTAVVAAPGPQSNIAVGADEGHASGASNGNEERRIGGKRKRFEPLRFTGPARKRGRTPDLSSPPPEDEPESTQRQVLGSDGAQHDLPEYNAEVRTCERSSPGNMRDDVRNVQYSSDQYLERPQGDPEKEQWRVGRLPGHQGSHVIRSEMGAEGGGRAGEKRGLPSSSLESERVLKKPFRLPAKVVLPVKQSLPHDSSPTRSAKPAELHTPQHPRSSTTFAPPRPAKPPAKPFVVPRKTSPTPMTPPTFSKLQLGTLRPRSSIRFGGSSPISLAAGVSSSRSSIASSPTPLLVPSSSSSSSVSSRAQKPFKSPFHRSPAPLPADGAPPRRTRAHPYTPTSHPSTGGAGAVSLARSSAPRALSRREYTHELEKEERTLKQALRFLTAPEEDQRLANLIPMWRAAGREVAEMLFGALPRPEPGMEGGAAGGAAGMGSGRGRGMWDSSPYDDPLSAEEKAYVDASEVNGRGELVGPDGEVIWGQRDEEEEEEGLMAMMSKIKPMGGDNSYREHRASLYAYASSDAPRRPAAPLSWSVGTMLSHMGIDVGLFGWNDEEEDWEEMEVEGH